MTVQTRSRYLVEALRHNYPLVDMVTASGIELKPAGPRRHKGLCPFHDDRRPSFLVYDDDQHFHCFACGAHGDVIDFVRRRFHLDFGEACAWLTGLPPQPVGSQMLMRREQRERRWDRLTLEEQVVMNTATALYHHRLWQEPRALAYVRRRGIPDRVIRACAVGYADGHSLETFLRRRSGLRVAQALGLLRRPGHDGDGPVGEFLAGRIVIPEVRGGHCIWFIGRSLDDGERIPKYLALPGERPILGYARAVGRREVFLCEGPFDYLTAVSWNLAAFSPCGTHLPVDRLGFLARVGTVWGVFDGDAAGQAASVRVAEHLGERWRPLALPSGMDLNDLALQPGGRATFFRLLSAARGTKGGAGDDGKTH
ncbi:MAG: DNA primase [Anaerolineae bacterium]